MKKIKKIIPLLIIVITICLVIYFAIRCFKYNYQIDGNYLIMISSLWGFGATLSIGIIAFWQNRKYQQLSDKMNDLALKPEIALLDEKDTKDIKEKSLFEYVNQITGNTTTKGCIDMIYGHISLPVTMLNMPIQNIHIKSVYLNGTELRVKDINYQSFYTPYTKFYITLFIDPDTSLNSTFSIILAYQNNCNYQYEKKIQLTWLDTGIIDNIIFKPAKRVS